MDPVSSMFYGKRWQMESTKKKVLYVYKPSISFTHRVQYLWNSYKSISNFQSEAVLQGGNTSYLII